MSGGTKLTEKQAAALSMIRVRPLEWLRHAPIEVRDLVLINANPAPFVKYGQSSFVRKLVRITGSLTALSNLTVASYSTTERLEI